MILKIYTTITTMIIQLMIILLVAQLAKNKMTLTLPILQILKNLKLFNPAKLSSNNNSNLNKMKKINSNKIKVRIFVKNIFIFCSTINY